VNTVINVGENYFCNGESNFIQDWIIVVSFNLLCGFINKNTNCKHCGGGVSLFENPSKRRGSASNLVIKCCKYDHTADIMTSNIARSRLYDNNIHLMYGQRSIGKGRYAGKVLCAVLNILQHLTSFSYNKTVGSAVAEVNESSMMEAAAQYVSENEEDVPSHITACFDGNWQKCGHTPLNDII
jgi:hypothetical protein